MLEMATTIAMLTIHGLIGGGVLLTRSNVYTRAHAQPSLCSLLNCCNLRQANICVLVDWLQLGDI